MKTLDESKYDNYTLIDAGIKDGKHASFGKLFDEEGLEIIGSAYDGVLFGAKVKFQDESARINYASVSDVESMFDGITIRLKGNDLYLQKLAGNLSYTATTIAASQFGYDTFIGRAFKMQLTTDVVNLDSEEEANDVLLGIWIDGQLANNTYVRLMDQAELLDCYINFNEGANTEFYSLWDIEAPADRDTEYYTISKENPYLVIADYLTNAKGISAVTATQDTLIGEFDRDGVKAYMITNFTEPSKGLSDTVELTLESGTRVQIYNNGVKETKLAPKGKLTITLEAGEAAFVVVGS